METHANRLDLSAFVSSGSKASLGVEGGWRGLQGKSRIRLIGTLSLGLGIRYWGGVGGVTLAQENRRPNNVWLFVCLHEVLICCLHKDTGLDPLLKLL